MTTPITPKYFSAGFAFYDLYVAGVEENASGWRTFTVEIDGTYTYTALFHPCDWSMHPRGKNMTLPGRVSDRHIEGIREAVRLHDLSIKTFERAIFEGKTARDAAALSRFEVIAAHQQQAI